VVQARIKETDWWGNSPGPQKKIKKVLATGRE
jgi:hypothetical protein